MRRRHFKYLKVHVTVYQVENANVSTSLNAHDLPFPQKSTSWGRQPPVDWYRALWWPSNDLDTSWCHKAEPSDGNWHKSHQMRWHDSSHAPLPFALPPPQEPATTQCWISTETYPVKKQARFRLLAHYACIFPSTISALSIIVHFSGIFPENYYFFRKKMKMKKEKKKFIYLYTFLLALKSMKNPLCNEEHYEVNCILGNCWGGNKYFSRKKRSI